MTRSEIRCHFSIQTNSQKHFGGLGDEAIFIFLECNQTVVHKSCSLVCAKKQMQAKNSFVCVKVNNLFFMVKNYSKLKL